MRFPQLEKSIRDKNLLVELNKIGAIRERFANQDGVGGQNCKSIHSS